MSAAKMNQYAMVSGLFFDFVDAIFNAPIVGMHVGQLGANRIQIALLPPQDFHHHGHVVAENLHLLAKIAHLGEHALDLLAQKFQSYFGHVSPQLQANNVALLNMENKDARCGKVVGGNYAL